ncbi:Uncharacterised protein [Legionella pneumophila]|uniref:phosphotransferase n=1 Tax=Legionella pneumophila TaxID=446 RepID=UPI000770AE1A|nr:phosphotransferase [Legionella pneumophila]CZG38532.1 Uncharacterised protein [Legionella pneumophila]CZH39898.1 Uncharacterised protein [Legionella pneumophila]
MHNNENIIHLFNWLTKQLNNGNSSELKTNTVVDTPWSTVIKVELGLNCYYLKQTPSDLFIEPDVINFIQMKIPNAPVPEILSINGGLDCFIMNSCGDISLRTKFNGSIDAELLIRGIKAFIKIQRSCENFIEEAITIGLPDWRIHRYPELYVELLERENLLLEEGLNQDEINKLIELVPTIESICNWFSRYKIKDTLVNCDFNENNMIINEATKKISIVDWGESVISHPFFTLAGHLRNTARRYKLDLNGPILTSIKQTCLCYWSDVANANEIHEIYQNIERLFPIYHALAIYRLQAATNNKSKQMQNFFISKSLRNLLNNERKIN